MDTSNAFAKASSRAARAQRALGSFLLHHAAPEKCAWAQLDIDGVSRAGLTLKVMV